MSTFLSIVIITAPVLITLSLIWWKQNRKRLKRRAGTSNQTLREKIPNPGLQAIAVTLSLVVAIFLFSWLLPEAWQWLDRRDILAPLIVALFLIAFIWAIIRNKTVKTAVTAAVGVMAAMSVIANLPQEERRPMMTPETAAYQYCWEALPGTDGGIEGMTRSCKKAQITRYVPNQVFAATVTYYERGKPYQLRLQTLEYDEDRQEFVGTWNQQTPAESGGFRIRHRHGLEFYGYMSNRFTKGEWFPISFVPVRL